MNTERLNALADYLEALPGSKPEIGFNMGSFEPEEGLKDKTRNKCGSCCCIAGHTLIMMGEGLNLATLNIPGRAAEYLGLTSRELDHLFAPMGTPIDDITLKRAITTIRHAAKHGKIDWDAA